MAFWSNRRKQPGLKWAWLGMLVLVQAGCGGGSPANIPPEEKSNGMAEGPANPGITAASPTKIIPVALDPRWQQSFLEAVRLDPPVDELRPPDLTKAGKSVGKIYQAVVGNMGKGGLWEEVKFVSPNGKRLHYSATLKTSAGAMKMDLYPEIAPNHVRNFVALARAGYYDGLSFDRARKEFVANSATDQVQYVEAGCPLGTGEGGYGSIGYWLKAEFSDKVRHEPGSVGAWHGEEPDSAGCKFYVTLNRAEWLDGQYTIFGKITQGLEVVRKIYNSPRVKGVFEDGLIEDRLENPVVIEQVIIHAEER